MKLEPFVDGLSFGEGPRWHQGKLLVLGGERPWRGLRLLHGKGGMLQARLRGCDSRADNRSRVKGARRPLHGRSAGKLV